MEPSRFDELQFFRVLQRSSVRALLIGRRALVVLGLPLLTADYDFRVAADDIASFNACAERFDLRPTHAPDAARCRGRYVLENDEHVDVRVSRSLTTVDGAVLAFDDAWARRVTASIGDAEIALPSIDDLILTKQVASRPKDLEDIRLLRILKEERS